MSDSHSDVDDELLILAGGGDDFSDDGSRPGSRQRSRSRSRSRSRLRSRSRSRSRPQSPRPADDSPPRTTAAKKTPARKRRSSAESEDEGEASEPGTPSSQQSAPMDESDSDDSDASPGKAVDDDDNKYPVDGMFTSHGEKKQIMSMTEIEREQILFEREQEKERLRQKALLRRLVTNNEDKQKKRKGGDADFEESQRKKPRGGTKFDALKRARAEKSDRRSRRENERRRDRSPSYRSSSSRSRHSGDSENEWGTPQKKRSKTPPAEAPLADLRDVERCRLSRTRFARVAFYPGFEAALTGSYVRIHIGPDPDTKMPTYRMAQVKGFKSGKAYAVENDRGKSIVVDNYVIAAHGNAKREWPWIAFSESNFTEQEWNRYQAVCKTEDVVIPRKPELAKKAADITSLINREWNDDEVQEKIKRQSALMDRYSGVERGRLEQQLDQAKRHGNVTLAAELQDKLDSMAVPRLAFQTTLKKAGPATTGPSQQDRLAEKNAQNRQLNAKNVRQAQLAERRRMREREVEEARASGDDALGGGGDPSHRPKARGTPAGKGAGAGAGASSAADGTPRAATSNANKPGAGADGDKDEADHVKKARETKIAETMSTKSGAPMIHTVLTDDDIIGSLDLDIDVEID